GERLDGLPQGGGVVHGPGRGGVPRGRSPPPALPGLPVHGPLGGRPLQPAGDVSRGGAPAVEGGAQEAAEDVGAEGRLPDTPRGGHDGRPPQRRQPVRLWPSGGAVSSPTRPAPGAGEGQPTPRSRPGLVFISPSPRPARAPAPSPAPPAPAGASRAAAAPPRRRAAPGR